MWWGKLLRRKKKSIFKTKIVNKKPEEKKNIVPELNKGYKIVRNLLIETLGKNFNAQ